jgi:hypothetical protein
MPPILLHSVLLRENLPNSQLVMATWKGNGKEIPVSNSP